jgi:hypothetical protein
MAWFAAAASSIGSFIGGNAAAIASLAAAGLSAYGQYQQGQAQQRQANATAAQLETQANQERAIAQLEAARRRREGKAQLSQQKSLLADSGFASDDPSSLHLINETVGAQTLEELLVLAQGEDAARQTEFQAQQVRQGGASAAQSGRLSALISVAEGFTSWYDRYGGGSRRTGIQNAIGTGLKPAKVRTG